MRKSFSVGLIIIAIGLGLLVAWVDSRPTWDDTGVTVGVILIAAAAFGALSPRRPWIWALAVGGWIPFLEIISKHDPASLLALAVGFVGAYAGALVRRASNSLGKERRPG